MDPRDRQYHPTTGVPQCSYCHANYIQVGDLSQYRGGVERDGVDNYCRSCFDGGELILCHDTKCRSGFCKDCVTRILGPVKLSAIQNNEDWYCMVCDYTQLNHLEVRRAAKPPDPKRERELKLHKADKPDKPVKPPDADDHERVVTISDSESEQKAEPPVPVTQQSEKSANIAPEGLIEPHNSIQEPTGGQPDPVSEEAQERSTATVQSGRPSISVPQPSVSILPSDSVAEEVLQIATTVPEHAVETLKSTPKRVAQAPSSVLEQVRDTPEPAPTRVLQKPSSVSGQVGDTPEPTPTRVLQKPKSVSGQIGDTPEPTPIRMLQEPSSVPQKASTQIESVPEEAAKSPSSVPEQGDALESLPKRRVLAPGSVSEQASKQREVASEKAVKSPTLVPESLGPSGSTSDKTVNSCTSTQSSAKKLPGPTFMQVSISSSSPSASEQDQTKNHENAKKGQGVKRRLPLSFNLFSTSAMCSKPREKSRRIEEPADIIIDESQDVPKQIPTIKDAGMEEAHPGKITQENVLDLEALEKELDMSDDDSEYVEALDRSDCAPNNVQTKPALPTVSAQVASVSNINDVEMRDLDIVEALEAHTTKMVEQAKAKGVSKVLRWALKDVNLLKERLDANLEALQATRGDFSDSRFRDDPPSLFSWVSNLETFLKQSKSMELHCQRIYKYLHHIGKK